MCSGERFVKISASIEMNLWRNCLAPSELISTITYSHPASTALRRKFCRKNLPGIVILNLFGCVSLSILKRIVLTKAVFLPACSKTAFISSQVVLLPLVPVTATTFISLEGSLYIRAPSKARQ